MIEEANWLNLDEDLEEMDGKPEGGFDAVICLGNSFAHLPDFGGNQVLKFDSLEILQLN